MSLETKSCDCLDCQPSFETIGNCLQEILSLFPTGFVQPKPEALAPWAVRAVAATAAVAFIPTWVPCLWLPTVTVNTPSKGEPHKTAAWVTGGRPARQPHWGHSSCPVPSFHLLLGVQAVLSCSCMGRPVSLEVRLGDCMRQSARSLSRTGRHSSKIFRKGPLCSNVMGLRQRIRTEPAAHDTHLLPYSSAGLLRPPPTGRRHRGALLLSEAPGQDHLLAHLSCGHNSAPVVPELRPLFSCWQPSPAQCLMAAHIPRLVAPFFHHKASNRR